MKVVHASYQRATATVQARFICALGNKSDRLQLDGVGQVAQAMSRVFKPGAEIAIDYSDDMIAFRNVEDVPSIDYTEGVRHGNTPLLLTDEASGDIRDNLRKA